MKTEQRPDAKTSTTTAASNFPGNMSFARDARAQRRMLTMP
eukprot:CAMPEP_0177750624 /NCGR_PEP_ID=MMETSP0484_2-20121128/33118_1 /TAXON_ID=354590 /ORGANISM="Rhodomonas lens, Strain RHODO" /LENGTH=40 /DNA_ID= /DNA_START= /DNA_END= /DNA_ORIENTATION=